ncbi:MAG: peptidoglycan DD-metalloendopeptidase family protein, partial [Myxococcota bacterium]|nr:peptidoglycan DD-metalloendopeptidase family protein [Myxococcota bacterium]
TLPPHSQRRGKTMREMSADQRAVITPINIPPNTRWLSLGGAPIDEPPLFWLGAYGELRPEVYTQPIFRGAGGPARTIHIGLDIGAPAGTPVFAPCAGRILHQGVNPADGDYGGVIVTEHQRGQGLRQRRFSLLFGHLAHASLRLRALGESFPQGALLAWLGRREENGGWAPHLHLQVSETQPRTHDLPGVVTAASFPTLSRRFPDPVSTLGLKLPPRIS